MQYISISGAVGAGKTTLLHCLLHELGPRAKAHEEHPENNPFIASSYENPSRWSFHSQITFLSLYFDCPDWKSEDCEFFFFDRCLEENLLLARQRLIRGSLQADEFHVVESLALGITGLMPRIDKYLYLRCSPDLLCQRYLERGRIYERSLDRSYAEEQIALYEQWIASKPEKDVYIVDEDAGIAMDQVVDFLRN